jgi:hypothetical protein
MLEDLRRDVREIIAAQGRRPDGGEGVEGPPQPRKKNGEE